jgi:phosphohistidine phosphatase
LDLYLLRNGEAGKRRAVGSAGSESSLTANGQKEVEDISRSLKNLGIKFDFVITSPLKQAQQTAIIVSKMMFKAEKKKMQQWNELAPEGNRVDLYRKLSQFQQESTILVVGHDPYLSEMISEIISDERGQRRRQQQRSTKGIGHHNLDLKKAGLARIRVNTTNPKLKGELRWLLTPRLLKRLQNVQSKAPF